MDQAIIELFELTKKYGSYTAVDRLSLAIPKGEVFGLLGPNGAGKSTTILMMMGLTEPDSGTVRVCGLDATSKAVEVKRRVGYLPEDVGFYQEFSGLENLAYTAQLNGATRKAAFRKAEELLEKVGLEGQGRKKSGAYSRGMRQRLGLADVLIKEPQVIILDEPTLGLDPEGVREFLRLIGQLSREEGLTVLLSSHHLHQVQQVCDRVGIFVSGRLIAEGDIPKLSRQLFSGEAVIVEARAEGLSRKVLEEQLKKVEGVKGVNGKRDFFRISCERDITGRVAREIISAGAELMHLQRKEYGLDDIYHRYFQGEPQ